PRCCQASGTRIPLVDARATAITQRAEARHAALWHGARPVIRIPEEVVNLPQPAVVAPVPLGEDAVGVVAEERVWVRLPRRRGRVRPLVHPQQPVPAPDPIVVDHSVLAAAGPVPVLVIGISDRARRAEVGMALGLEFVEIV